MTLTFVDVNGNPFPTGINVIIADAYSNVVGQGVTTTGGVFLNVSVIVGTIYTASFSGPSAPISSITFICPPSALALATESGTTLTTEGGATLGVDGSLGTAIVSIQNYPNLAFVDSTGLNPLPSGVGVTIYFGASIVGKGVITPGGLLNITLQPNAALVAVFSGTQAPTMPAPFTTNGLGSGSAIVPNYQSPSYSVTGYAAESAAHLPAGWFVDSASTGLPSNVDPVTYAVLLGMSQGIALQDTGIQNVLGAMRLPSSLGLQIDTYAFDLFRGTFARFSQLGETDPQWFSRIQTILRTQKTTVAGLQTIINVFWPYITQQLGTATNLAEDTMFGGSDATGGEDFVTAGASGATQQGQALGEDTFGGLDTSAQFEDAIPVNLPPIPVVFDAQTNPTLAAYLSPSLTFPQFCVYLQYPNYSDTLIKPVQAQSTILAALVAAWKALGTVPIFAQNR